ncbi:MAG: hypothetical protein JWO10_1672 [Microbacteriaceae bacterium]|jgi:hypothetical protein|nr:hypothetical protein [Microbacteriaceae bacterium]
MDSQHVLRLVFGLVLVVGGTAAFIFRKQFSAISREERARRGRPVGPRTQSPLQLGIGGLGFALIGLGLVITTFTGFAIA